MLNYLKWYKVDWSFTQLDDPERAVVRRIEALLQSDPRSVTEPWLKEILTEAGQELPGRRIVAVFEDAKGRAGMLTAEGGQIAAAPADGATFARLRETRATTLFPEELRASDFRAAGVDRIACRFFYQPEVLEEIRAHALRMDRSLSWVVQAAWQQAQERLQALEPDEVPETEPGREAQTVYFPIDALEEIDAMADRLDCSRSRVVDLAWGIARSWMAELPNSTPD